MATRNMRRHGEDKRGIAAAGERNQAWGTGQRAQDDLLEGRCWRGVAAHIR